MSALQPVGNLRRASLRNIRPPTFYVRCADGQPCVDPVERINRSTYFVNRKIVVECSTTNEDRRVLGLSSSNQHQCGWVPTSPLNLRSFAVIFRANYIASQYYFLLLRPACLRGARMEKNQTTPDFGHVQTRRPAKARRICHLTSLLCTLLNQRHCKDEIGVRIKIDNITENRRVVVNLLEALHIVRLESAI